MKKLILCLFVLLMANSAFCATEDFTTYTLGGDAGAVGDLSTTTTRVSASSGLLGNENAYAIKNYGAGHFGNFQLDFTLNTQTQGSLGLAGFCLSNTSNTNMAGMNAADDGICIQYGRVFSTDGARMRNYNSGTTASTIVALAGNTSYYFRWIRTDTTCTMNIYSDSGRTTAVSGSPQAMTCPDGAVTLYQFVYGISSAGGEESATGNSQMYVENFTITDADSGGGASSGACLDGACADHVIIR